MGWTLVDNWTGHPYYTDVTGMLTFKPDWPGGREHMLWVACHGADLVGAKIRYLDKFGAPTGVSTNFSSSNRSGDLIIFKEHVYVGVDERVFRLNDGVYYDYVHHWEEVHDFDIYPPDELAQKGYVTDFEKTYDGGTLIALVLQPYGTDSPNVWIYSTTDASTWSLEFDGRNDWPLPDYPGDPGECFYASQHGLAISPDNKIYALIHVYDYPNLGESTAVLLVRSDDGTWNKAGLEWSLVTAPYGHVGHGLGNDYYQVFASIDEGAGVFAIHNCTNNDREYQAPVNLSCFNNFYYYYGNVFAVGGRHNNNYEAYVYRRTDSGWQTDPVGGPGGIGHIDCGWQALSEYRYDGELYAAGGHYLYKRTSVCDWSITIGSATGALDVGTETGSRIHVGLTTGLGAVQKATVLLIPSTLESVGVAFRNTVSGNIVFGVISEYNREDTVCLYGTISGVPIARTLDYCRTWSGWGYEFQGDVCRKLLRNDIYYLDDIALTDVNEAWHVTVPGLKSSGFSLVSSNIGLDDGPRGAARSIDTVLVGANEFNSNPGESFVRSFNGVVTVSNYEEGLPLDRITDVEIVGSRWPMPSGVF